MFLYQSANLEYNLHCGCYPWHMHQDWKFEHSVEEHVNMHIQLAHSPFGNLELPQCHWVAQMPSWVEWVSVLGSPVWVGLVEGHMFLCASSVSADFFVCHLDTEGSHPCDFHKQLPSGFLSGPSPFYAQETQLPASSLHGLLRKVFLICCCVSSIVAHKNPPLAIWPYSRQCACRLFLLYPTSLPCHSTRHIENLLENSRCFWKWDSGITSTIYSSVALSRVLKPVVSTPANAYHDSVGENPRADNIMKFDFTDSVYTWLGGPWMFPVIGNNILVR